MKTFPNNFAGASSYLPSGIWSPETGHCPAICRWNQSGEVTSLRCPSWHKVSPNKLSFLCPVNFALHLLPVRCAFSTYPSFYQFSGMFSIACITLQCFWNVELSKMLSRFGVLTQLLIYESQWEFTYLCQATNFSICWSLNLIIQSAWGKWFWLYFCSLKSCFAQCKNQDGISNINSGGFNIFRQILLKFWPLKPSITY